MSRLFLIIGFFLLGFCSVAQNELNLARKGNKLYSDNKYVDAEVYYKKSLNRNPDFSPSVFNLGDSYFKQKRYEEAARQFEKSTTLTKNKSLIAKSYHNLGNTMLESFKTENDQQKKSEKLDQAIKAYQNALKNNPKDIDTKYNLSYAMRMKNMMQQQQQQKQNKQNQEQQKKQEKQQQQPQQNKQELTRQEAEKLLDAIQSQEKEVHQRVNKKETVPVKVKIEKEW